MPVRSYKGAEEATQKSHTGTALFAPDPRGQALSIGIGSKQESEFHKVLLKCICNTIICKTCPVKPEFCAFGRKNRSSRCARVKLVIMDKAEHM